MSLTVRAEEAGARVWEFATEIPTNPHRLAQGLERMLENERKPLEADADEGSWVRRIAELTVKQERLLDQHLDGDITTEQFRTKSTELEDARVAAEDQLKAARSRLARLEDIERSKNALISHYASLVPQGLAELSAEERNRIYKMMRLRVLADRKGALIADWGCNDASILLDSCRTRGR